MNNWKNVVAQSIKQIDVPAPSRDEELARQLRAKLDDGTISTERDRTFAQSLVEGFIKWGSFTDAQRPHVERLLNPQPNTDQPLAETLRACLGTGLLSIGDMGFADSLLRGYDQYGRFTDRQRPYVIRLLGAVERAQNLAGKAPESLPAATSPATGTRVAGQVKIAHRAPNICGTVNLDKFARFAVGDLVLTLKNDGSLIWVKWQGQLAGMIDPRTGEYRETAKYCSRAELDACLEALVLVEHDPLAAARSNGVLTGRCSCCGRALTDPVSIGFGIGPVCRSRGWGIA